MKSSLVNLSHFLFILNHQSGMQKRYSGFQTGKTVYECFDLAVIQSLINHHRLASRCEDYATKIACTIALWTTNL